MSRSIMMGMVAAASLSAVTVPAAAAELLPLHVRHHYGAPCCVVLAVAFM
jgi:hypothetical protein